MFRFVHMVALMAVCGIVAADDAPQANSPAGPVDDHWPRWRGPAGDGHYHGTLPLRWSQRNVVWKTELAGVGQSTPMVSGDRIFLTTATDEGRRRHVLCLDRSTGRIVWQQQVPWEGTPEPLHKMNSHATPSCVTDGQIVVAFFGVAGLHAYSVDGQHLWSRDLGPFVGPWGVASCPVLVDDLVVQAGDADEDAFIAAFHKRTGETVWRTPRPNFRGWSTPILIEARDDQGQPRRELVVNGHTGVTAYDPSSGRQLWFCKSFNGRGTPTVTPGHGLLFAVNGLRGDMYSIRPGGEGDVTQTRMVWHSPRTGGGRDLPSPIVLGRAVLVMNMGGILTCYDALTGQQLWQQRIGGNFSASPIACRGRAYFLSEEGETVVVQPENGGTVVARNLLRSSDDEIFRATPTPHRGELLLRSDRALYCIGNGEAGAP
jgi:outer membrane protein assembly factor BamB